MNQQKSLGFTITEVTIALTAIGLLTAVLFGFMVNGLTQYGITGARAELLNEAQIALDIAANDIRLSANADANNRWPDDYAPEAPDDILSWVSDDETLVLATVVEDASGAILFSDAANYISHKNNSIYFVRDGSLYKRVLAATVTGNTAVTTCPETHASSACPADRRLLNNVEEFRVAYYDHQNQEVAPDSARSIELYVRLRVQRYPESVTAEYKTRMVFRND